jgi:LPS export ABC transporter protein LptC
MKGLGRVAVGLVLLLLILEMVVMNPSDVTERSNSTSVVRTEYNDQAVQHMMTGIHVIESNGDKQEWELWADQAVGVKDSENLAMNNIKAQFFGDDGLIFLVTGKKGVIGQNSKNINIEGGVKTEASNGYRFTTASLEYLAQSKSLRCPTAVDVLGPADPSGRRMTVKGESMNADIVRGVVRLSKNIVAEKSLQDNGHLSVLSDNLEIKDNEKTIRFFGNVRMKLNGTEISGPDATFQIGKEAEIFNSVKLSGGVFVKDANKSATADRLDIDLLAKKFIFEGNPKVIQDNDEVQGDKIIFLDGGKQVKIQNAKIRVGKSSLEKFK